MFGGAAGAGTIEVSTVGNNGTIRGTAGYHEFATSQGRMRSAIRVGVAWGTLVEYLPSRPTQFRRPTGC